MDDREQTILNLKKLEERDKQEGSKSKAENPPGVPPDGVDIEGPAQHKPPLSVEEYLKSLAEGKPSQEDPQAGHAAPDPAAAHAAGGHVHFRVAPPKSNAPGHFP
jgi:hypothetical protein